MVFQPGNKLGGRPVELPRDNTQINYGFTRADLRKRIQYLLLAEKDEVQRILNHPKSQWIDICIASILVKCAKEGDPRRLEILLDRIHGKVKEVIEVSGSVQHVAAIDLSRIPTDKLLLIEEALNAARIHTAKDTDTSGGGGARSAIPLEVLPDPES